MITKHQKDILARMKTGSRLCVENTDEGRMYFFSDGGWRPNALAVDSLRNSAMIAPSDDGMFGDNQSFDLIFIPGEGVFGK